MPPSPIPHLLPNPNGYHVLLGAAERIVGEIPRGGRYDQADAAELAEWVEPNREALRLAGESLAFESRVPLNFLREDFEQAMQHLKPIRRLARLMDAAARYASLKGRPGEAADHYLDLVRLGPASSRGGLIVQRLAAIAIERLGLAGLARIRDALDARACRALAAALETLDAQQEPPAETFARDHRWELAVNGCTGGPIYFDKTNDQFRQVPPIDTAAELVCVAQALEFRRLAAALAARAYLLERGSTPGSLEALVPDYLSALPLDPASGCPLRYQVDGEARFSIERPT